MHWFCPDNQEFRVRLACTPNGLGWPGHVTVPHGNARLANWLPDGKYVAHVCQNTSLSFTSSRMTLCVRLMASTDAPNISESGPGFPCLETRLGITFQESQPRRQMRRCRLKELHCHCSVRIDIRCTDGYTVTAYCINDAR